MGVSKVTFGGTTIIDLTEDSVVEDALVAGYTAHGANGEKVLGGNPYEKNATDTEVKTQAQLISDVFKVLKGKSVEGGGTAEVLLKDETFTKNGTYYVPSGYDGFGIVVVDVPTGTPETWTFAMEDGSTVTKVVYVDA